MTILKLVSLKYIRTKKLTFLEEVEKYLMVDSWFYFCQASAISNCQVQKMLVPQWPQDHTHLILWRKLKKKINQFPFSDSFWNLKNLTITKYKVVSLKYLPSFINAVRYMKVKFFRLVIWLLDNCSSLSWGIGIIAEDGTVDSLLSAKSSLSRLSRSL